MDNRANRPGLLYNRRTAVDGSDEDKLRQACDAAVSAAALLERAPELSGKVRFDHSALEVFVNDRLLAPNTEETFQRLSGPIHAVLSQQLGGPVDVERDSNPRGLFRVLVRRQA